MEDSKHENQENALGSSGVDRTHRTAFGGIPSPVAVKKGATATHPGRQQHRSGVRHDEEPESPTRSPDKEVRPPTLNPLAAATSRRPLRFRKPCEIRCSSAREKLGSPAAVAERERWAKKRHV